MKTNQIGKTKLTRDVELTFIYDQEEKEWLVELEEGQLYEYGIGNTKEEALIDLGECLLGTLEFYPGSSHPEGFTKDAIELGDFIKELIECQ